MEKWGGERARSRQRGSIKAEMGSTWPAWGMRGDELQGMGVGEPGVGRQAGPDRGPGMPVKD